MLLRKHHHWLLAILGLLVALLLAALLPRATHPWT